MGKPNFGFQKRQKELARQKKKEEKKQRKGERAGKTDEGAEQSAPETGQNADRVDTNEPAS